jgi:hypothetical protein
MSRSTGRRAFLFLLAAAVAVWGAGCGDTGGDSTTIYNVSDVPDVLLYASNPEVYFDPGNSAAHASNLKAALMDAGLSVELLFQIQPDKLTRRANVRQIFAVPTLAFAPAFTPNDENVIADFVYSGGTLLICRASTNNDLALIHNVFGITLTFGGAGTYALDASAAAGTPFEGGPATLLDNYETYSISINANFISAGGKAIYRTASPNSVVSVFPFGSGSIVILGWTWYDAFPVGGQDGGWNDVLIRATQL